MTRKLTESWLGSIHEIEESIGVLLRLVKLRESHRIGGDCLLVHEEEERLLGMQLQSSSDDVHQFSDGDMIRNKELASIHQGKGPFSLESFDDQRNLQLLLSSNLCHIVLTGMERTSLLEGGNGSTGEGAGLDSSEHFEHI
ncbi:hypothetical protein PMAYCL1PPCAC_18120 [Pristionchus mayeri]|uniref:Uncharacterized protein n=1 Tax=Pristionchus mayeri TaxID=1317129 RepID=A0AAN5I1A7_9BILA|nr:hypothetical protein PMAYCL1PPCAC_18120 [Pristionchus mayeri]